MKRLDIQLRDQQAECARLYSAIATNLKVMVFPERES